MNDQQYLQHCRAQLDDFTATLVKRTTQLPEDHPLRELAEAFSALAADSSDFYTVAPELVARLFDTYPEFAPTFPRELLWFLGGECLHYMADEEIARFQQLDELRLAAASRGEILNFPRSHS